MAQRHQEDKGTAGRLFVEEDVVMDVKRDVVMDG